jgi:hypothetical protein
MDALGRIKRVGHVHELNIATQIDFDFHCRRHQAFIFASEKFAEYSSQASY